MSDGGAFPKHSPLHSEGGDRTRTGLLRAFSTDTECMAIALPGYETRSSANGDAAPKRRNSARRRAPREATPMGFYSGRSNSPVSLEIAFSPLRARVTPTDVALMRFRDTKKSPGSVRPRTPYLPQVRRSIFNPRIGLGDPSVPDQ